MDRFAREKLESRVHLDLLSVLERLLANTDKLEEVLQRPHFRAALFLDALGHLLAPIGDEWFGRVTPRLLPQLMSEDSPGDWATSFSELASASDLKFLSIHHFDLLDRRRSSIASLSVTAHDPGEVAHLRARYNAIEKVYLELAGDRMGDKRTTATLVERTYRGLLSSETPSHAAFLLGASETSNGRRQGQPPSAPFPSEVCRALFDREFGTDESAVPGATVLVPFIDSVCVDPPEELVQSATFFQSLLEEETVADPPTAAESIQVFLGLHLWERYWRLGIQPYYFRAYVSAVPSISGLEKPSNVPAVFGLSGTFGSSFESTWTESQLGAVELLDVIARGAASALHSFAVMLLESYYPRVYVGRLLQHEVHVGSILAALKRLSKKEPPEVSPTVHEELVALLGEIGYVFTRIDEIVEAPDLADDLPYFDRLAYPDDVPSPWQSVFLEMIRRDKPPLDVVVLTITKEGSADSREIRLGAPQASSDIEETDWPSSPAFSRHFLRAILVNLIQNSLTHGSPSTIELRILVRATGDYVEISLSDDGAPYEPQAYPLDPMSPALGLKLIDRLVNRALSQIDSNRREGSSPVSFKLPEKGAGRAGAPEKVFRLVLPLWVSSE